MAETINNEVKEEKENVTTNPEVKEAENQQPIEGTVEGEGTSTNDDPPSPEADDIQPTFKEKFVNGAKAVGRGAKKVAKAVKPYAIGAAIGIGTAAYAGLKIYKAVKDGSNDTPALGTDDTPLLTVDDQETNYLDNVDYVSEAPGDVGEADVDVPETSVDLDIEL